ncbi:putative 2-aminoethylphosphonate ABC transporter substrate-binding protein [Piscinibacter terrae]|uniref:Putative 2-aminoethylphosphonate ABC transporter substrate-binding protein n=1 Tax=Piscinibacter terrae TaxID=2496871 RepID=A0A3N7JYN4_9BURK|nr:putative 2-aminoethylphosphonate ABC transporter substrate-binding protein [Albitalea terrae]RQP25919.1 putative 2-aminoethylphosphonate ABC transporter substrate-binding protein [Albitalea terrae]
MAWSWRRPAWGVAMFAALCPAAFAQRTQLVVYTALEPDQVKAYAAAFARSQPDIDIKWVRHPNGVITEMLLDERSAPQADVVMGVAATSLAVLDKRGVLLPYAPAHLENISAQYRDRKNPPAWWGMDVWGAAICFNTVEAARRNIPRPETWKDLARPVYRGVVVMPSPVSSGTGFFDVTAWLTLFGDDSGKGGGWQFMDALHSNVSQYTASGSKPCTMASTGDAVVGISFEYRGNTNKAKGAPIDLVFPREGLGWDLESLAIVKGTRRVAAAKLLADWASSPEAMTLYGRNFAITAQPGMAEALPNIPHDYERRLVKMDFGWAADNRDRILAEWTRRYGAKSESQK